ncbi:MAG: M48 family metallopeptidase [Oligosphaeraceae bacterium]|nr:M48 family metallopeptidase [Oligosphaeraceae bacterium]
MNSKILLTCILAGLLCTACRSVPLSQRSQLLLTSEDYENELGATAYSEYQKEYPRSNNKTYTDALQRVGEAISRVAGKDEYQWEFVVLESSEANAFCLPGGKVAVYSGIFQFTANEAELATIVSHEIAHALARHGGERMSWAQLQQIGALGLRASGTGSAWETLYGVGTELGVMLPFSRKHEHEADSIGLILLARAGYHPAAAISFWQKFSSGRNPSLIEQWTSTHPGGAERIENLQEMQAQAVLEYNQSPQKFGLGRVFPAAR